MQLVFVILRNYFKAPKVPRVLGRWCHQGYSKTCDIDIKSHLANIDNGLGNKDLGLNTKNVRNTKVLKP